jgi:hypothetical protein
MPGTLSFQHSLKYSLYNWLKSMWFLTLEIGPTQSGETHISFTQLDSECWKSVQNFF